MSFLRSVEKDKAIQNQSLFLEKSGTNSAKNTSSSSTANIASSSSQSNSNNQTRLKRQKKGLTTNPSSTPQPPQQSSSTSITSPSKQNNSINNNFKLNIEKKSTFDPKKAADEKKKIIASLQSDLSSSSSSQEDDNNVNKKNNAKVMKKRKYEEFDEHDDSFDVEKEKSLIRKKIIEKIAASSGLHNSINNNNNLNNNSNIIISKPNTLNNSNNNHNSNTLNNIATNINNINNSNNNNNTSNNNLSDSNESRLFFIYLCTTDSDGTHIVPFREIERDGSTSKIICCLENPNQLITLKLVNNSDHDTITYFNIDGKELNNNMVAVIKKDSEMFVSGMIDEEGKVVPLCIKAPQEASDSDEVDVQEERKIIAKVSKCIIREQKKFDPTIAKSPVKFQPKAKTNSEHELAVSVGTQHSVNLPSDLQNVTVEGMEDKVWRTFELIYLTKERYLNIPMNQVKKAPTTSSSSNIISQKATTEIPSQKATNATNPPIQQLTSTVNLKSQSVNSTVLGQLHQNNLLSSQMNTPQTATTTQVTTTIENKTNPNLPPSQPRKYTQFEKQKLTEVVDRKKIIVPVHSSFDEDNEDEVIFVKSNMVENLVKLAHGLDVEKIRNYHPQAQEWFALLGSKFGLSAQDVAIARYNSFTGNFFITRNLDDKTMGFSQNAIEKLRIVRAALEKLRK